MSTSTQKTPGDAVRLTGVGLGVGTLVTLLVAGVVALLADEPAGAFGLTVAIGMLVTSVVTVGLVLMGTGRRA